MRCAEAMMNETSQVSETTDDLTSMTSEGQYIMFSATFMVKVGVCQTFQEGEYSRKQKDTLQEQIKSHVKKTLDNVTSGCITSKGDLAMEYFLLFISLLSLPIK